ncbi:hypothetical protein ABU614_00965 [Lysobacter firmicutimachus]|uniref:Uncharacterized protein n=1 Tax=Lysobacter firmicutimachus TaxID=1792846 RepID=A0AAU8MUW1_9GAMM|nr:hypothetical protein [Lysobacter antibioticus]
MPKEATMSPQEFAQYCADHIEALHKGAAQASSRISALQIILDAVISAHPNPKGILGVLEMARPELVDSLVDTPPEGDAAIWHDARQEAFKAALSHYTEFLEKLIALRKSDDEDD